MNLQLMTVLQFPIELNIEAKLRIFNELQDTAILFKNNESRIID